MTDLKIRCIIQIRENGFTYNEANRISILEKSLDLDADKIDLVITSNEFFTFSPHYLVSGKQFVEEYIIKKIQNFKTKKPVVIGSDLFNSRISFNPYNGIDTIVCYLINNIEDEYEYSTHIWECWKSKEIFDQNGFQTQNEKRVVEINGKKICLLSCGDILKPCHNSGDLLPEADIYVSLAHINFSKWLVSPHIQGSNIANIQRWKQDDNKIVLVTQQITNDKIDNKNYFSNDKYQLIWPEEKRNEQSLRYFDCNCNEIQPIEKEKASYIFIDISL